MENHLNTESTLDSSPSLNNCWNQIGVMGDRSCPELKTAIHCRNCSVYSLAGRSLLEREAPTEYLQEWTDILASTPQDSGLRPIDGEIVQPVETFSAMIFRLGKEWLALPVRLLQEVTQPCVIHSLPHRSNQLFLGLANIRGEILLCVALHHLLSLESADSSQNPNAIASKKMIVIANTDNRWVFQVDEVRGVHRFQLNDLERTPVVISKASSAYTKGVIEWNEHKLNYLDADLLLQTLSRRIL